MSEPVISRLRIITTANGSDIGFKLELIESASSTLSSSGNFTAPLPGNFVAELQWYLEDFLEERDDAATVRAELVRDSIKHIGKRLFESLFQANAECRTIWRRSASNLGRTQIEILESSGQSGLPWELLRDPTTNTPLCLSAARFIRDHEGATPESSEALTRLKVLLVISRPYGTGDVELRSIASTIYGALRESSRFEVHVLRPPTYETLQRTLQDAKAQNVPYDLIHFDGHGLYYPSGITESGEEYGGGYLLFEHDIAEEGEPISGQTFGLLADECGVKAVVLNACRSAYQEPSENDDRPASSFSHAVIAAGVPSVIAMNFNVYVSSAKAFMEEFYSQLGNAQPIGVAATLARKHLSIRQASYHQDTSTIDDWLVPAIFGTRNDLRVVPAGPTPRSAKRTLPRALPPAPDNGFIGSDDALLMIDRNFDLHNIILLFGLAGGGKSATSVEFSTWYQETSPGITTLLFTSFEASPTLAEILATAEPEIGNRVKGLDLTDATAQETIVASLARRGAIWLWDNVETIHSLDETERQRFSDFVDRANRGGLKLLLTARDQQESWLRDMPLRIEMPSFRPSESLEYTKRILAEKKIRKFDPKVWQPLMDFAGGNPLTLKVAVSSYLSTSKKTSAKSVSSFVEDLKHGVAELNDSPDMDRANSLIASLNYGFERSFDAHAMKVLSLLSRFRTYVNSFTVQYMCRPITSGRSAGFPDHDFSWTIPDLYDETQQTIEVVLDKAVELGLLRKSSDHNYWLHPAIHLHLRPFFEKAYPNIETRQVAGRAYAEAEGLFSIQFIVGLQEGARTRVIEALTKESDNLEQALFTSHENGWKQAEVGLLHGLNALLIHQGRYEQWRVLFSKVWTDFIGPALEPLPGCEKWWSFIMDHRLRIALEDRDVERGEPIARLIKTYEEKQTAKIPRKVGFRYNRAQRKALHDLAIATGRLADILRLKDDAHCLTLNEEAIGIYELIDDNTGISIRELNLGHCYKNVPSIRDLVAAELHYRNAFEKAPESDDLARSQALAQISMTWRDAIEDEGEETLLTPELQEKLASTIEQYEEALKGIPEDAVGNLANLHNNLANALRLDPVRRPEAIEHMRKAHDFAVAIGRYDEAATFRANLAQVFAMLHRPAEASAAAEQALGELRELGLGNTAVTRTLARIIQRGS